MIVQFDLKPRGLYHFMAEGYKKEGAGSDYLRPSLPVPPQSAVLGFLRHLGLVRSGLIGLDGGLRDREEAVARVGSGSFLHLEDGEATYGDIQRVSAVSIAHRGTTFSPAGYDVLNGSSEVTWVRAEASFADGSSERTGLAMLKGYEAKSGWADLWQHGGEPAVDSAAWIHEGRRPALQLSREDKENDLGQLHGHSLDSDCAFRFSVELANDLYRLGEAKSWSGVFPFGAEQALWSVDIRVVEAWPTSGIQPVPATLPAGMHRAVLQSDAWVPGSAAALVAGGISQSITHRNIKSRLRRDPAGNRKGFTTSFAALTEEKSAQDADIPVRSGLTWLLRRGSVLLIEDGNWPEFLNLMTAGHAAPYAQIGYNQFTHQQGN